MQQAEEFRKYIEAEVLKVIGILAEKGETSKEKLQNIAQTTLKLIKPGMTIDQLYCSAVKLDDNCLELAPVVMRIMRQYEEKYEKKALDHVSRLVKDKKFSEAEDVIKKVLEFKIAN